MFITVGISTLDLFVSGLETIPASGGNEFTVDNLAFCDRPLNMVLGGNGAITAYVLAKLGASAQLCSAIGSDPMGDIVHGWLTNAGVKTQGLIRSEQAATPTTTVITDSHLNRLSFHHPGASTIYQTSDLPETIWDKAYAILLSSYPLLPAWRPQGFVEVVEQARERNVVTVLDIGPAIGQPAELDELRSLLPHIDYFICNDHEIAVCTGMKDLTEGMDQVLDAGASCVVIKRGEQGAVARSTKDADLLEVPSFTIDAQFTVGAGDSFNAGFLYATQQGEPLEKAIRFANAVAALVVSASQGALGAPSLEEVERLLGAT